MNTEFPEKTADSNVDKYADKYRVPALERGLRLLQEFGREGHALGAPEVARRLQLSRATVFRMLNTLESMGFLQRDGKNSNEYRLGMAVLRLGFEFLASMELPELGQPVIERLSAALALPCNIVVRDERFVVYVAKVTPPAAFISSVRVGTRLPAHATVSGHTLLADLSLPELRMLYPENHLQRYSAQTPATVDELFNQVQEARARGYVLSEGFFEPNISTVAAPVRDHSGRVVAALTATVSAPQLDEAQRPQWIEQVCKAAAELSQQLNYRPPKKDNIVPIHISTESRHAG